MERTGYRSFAIACAFLLAALLGALSAPPPAFAQQAGGSPAASYDPSLRALQYYRYKRVAESGPERGRELYYFKCWQCHNEFQKTAPQLKGLYRRRPSSRRRARHRCGPRQQDQERRTRPCRRSATSSTTPTSPTSSASCARSAAGILRTRRAIRNIVAAPVPTLAAGKGQRARRAVGLRAIGGSAPRRRCAAASKAAPKGVRSKASWCNCAARNPTSPPRSTPTRADGLSSPSCRPAPTRCGSRGRWSSSLTRSNARRDRGRRRKARRHRARARLQRRVRAGDIRESKPSLRAPSWSGTSTAPRRRNAPSATAAAPAATPMGRSCATASTRRGWRAMVTKMTHWTGSLLLHEARPNRIPPEEQDVIVKWLTKVRGPECQGHGLSSPARTARPRHQGGDHRNTSCRAC